MPASSPWPTKSSTWSPFFAGSATATCGTQTPTRTNSWRYGEKNSDIGSGARAGFDLLVIWVMTQLCISGNKAPERAASLLTLGSKDLQRAHRPRETACLARHDRELTGARAARVPLRRQ